MQTIWTWLLENKIGLTAFVFAIVGAARLFVMLTPTKADDSWLARVIVWASYIGLHIPDAKAEGIAESKHAIKVADAAEAKKVLRAQKRAGTH